jgi:hypothetical protein
MVKKDSDNLTTEQKAVLSEFQEIQLTLHSSSLSFQLLNTCLQRLNTLTSKVLEM